MHGVWGTGALGTAPDPALVCAYMIDGARWRDSLSGVSLLKSVSLFQTTGAPRTYDATSSSDPTAGLRPEPSGNPMGGGVF